MPLIRKGVGGAGCTGCKIPDDLRQKRTNDENVDAKSLNERRNSLTTVDVDRFRFVFHFATVS